jgi:hypothetical protein
MCSQLGRHSLVRYSCPSPLAFQDLMALVTFFSFWSMEALRSCSGALLPVPSGNRWYMRASQKWRAYHLQPVVNTTGSQNLLLDDGRNCLVTIPVSNCTTPRAPNTYSQFQAGSLLSAGRYIWPAYVSWLAPSFRD